MLQLQAHTQLTSMELHMMSLPMIQLESLLNWLQEATMQTSQVIPVIFTMKLLQMTHLLLKKETLN